MSQMITFSVGAIIFYVIIILVVVLFYQRLKSIDKKLEKLIELKEAENQK